MGKKKFFDKKKSATFQLLARDSSDPNYDGTAATDRVFVRVDNHSYTLPVFDDGPVDASGSASFEENPNSIFADAPDDYDDEENGGFGASGRSRGELGGPASLPENVRREILELGFPDDGYNYLLHLRDIKNTGGGSAFYNNPKAKLNQLPRDEKAYDASGVLVSQGTSDADENIMYKVASKTVGVKVQNAIDPEIAALLDDDDLSRFGSDVEDLEEDFVVQANLCEEGEDGSTDNKFSVAEDFERATGSQNIIHNKSFGDEIFEDADVDHVEDAVDKPRTRRLLDDQFDTLLSRDYASGDDGGSDCDEHDGWVAEEDESLAQKLKHALGDHSKDDLDLDQGYKAPADILSGKEGSADQELLQSASDVIHRCMEYAEKYQNEDDDIEDEYIFEESSDESEVWDCETIVSTCSNLNNHPGKIVAPEITRRKKLAETVSGALNSKNSMITLKGKEKLPVDFLPHGRKVVDKVKDNGSVKTEQQKRKLHGPESKEEKKERKAAVKEARREARRTKKELKELYKGETHRAQKVVAVSGPASIHLM